MEPNVMTVSVTTQASEPDDAERVQLEERLVAINEQLIRAAVHQHELTEQAERLNAQLQAEIAERKVFEQKLQAALRKEELLRREIHHRVKNNTQIISSLLFLQAARVTDPALLEVLRESRLRVRSLALIHELLYQHEDLDCIRFTDYVRQLSADLFSAYHVCRERVALQVETDDVFLNIDTALPCGLITGELISNALKYAFPDDRPGTVAIRMECLDDSRFKLSVHDNGVGLPPEFRIEQAPTVGLKLVVDMSRQLEGTLNVESGPAGTLVTVIFGQCLSPSRI